MIIGMVFVAIGCVAGGFAAWSYKWSLALGILVSVVFIGTGIVLALTGVLDGPALSELAIGASITGMVVRAFMHRSKPGQPLQG